MNETSLTALFILLVGLIILSAFFSSSETGMMSLNRYRLKHMANTGHKGAQRAQGLLNRTDQLIGVILIGNNFVNILASSIATVIGALPLVIRGGAGAAARQSIGVVVVFGFSLATLITLFLIPIFYSRVAKRTVSPQTVSRKLESALKDSPEPAE